MHTRARRFPINQGTGFTDEMRITMSCDVSPNKTSTLQTQKLSPEKTEKENMIPCVSSGVF